MLRYFFLCLLLFCACSGELAITSAQLGSHYSIDGDITAKSLLFKFKPFKREKGESKKVKDLFNYIYFEEDTLCFAFSINRSIKKDRVAVWFINPATGERFPAERIDMFDKKIAGFSLVGSLLERFYKQDLQKPLPANAYCCKKIPFIVRIDIREDAKTISSQVKGSFRVEYK
ncbi:MAG: hypothetical protein GY754_11460 [bacterium]|nr:hypothetical protein [bacterium]